MLPSMRRASKKACRLPDWMDSSPTRRRTSPIRVTSTRYYKSPEFNRLLNAANGTMDPQKRKELLHQTARVLYDDPPAAFLYRERNIYGLGERLTWKPTTDQTVSAVEMRLK
jgi:ABC-type transport system substrate-binding protein